MLYTIVKKCSDYDDVEDGKKDFNLKEIMGTDISKLPAEDSKSKKR